MCFLRKDVGGSDFSVMDDLVIDDVYGCIRDVLGMLGILFWFWKDICERFSIEMIRCCVDLGSELFV